jgi:hypothetical protein
LIIITFKGRYLRKIKNKVMQKPGICKDQLDWMAAQAQKECVSVAGRHGYVTFDEMAIQVRHDMSICVIASNC